MIDTEPRREDTETRHCPDCGTDTTHLLIEWSHSTTHECRECGVIYEGDPT